MAGLPDAGYGYDYASCTGKYWVAKKQATQSTRLKKSKHKNTTQQHTKNRQSGRHIE
jgi:hypothetical protein